MAVVCMPAFEWPVTGQKYSERVCVTEIVWAYFKCIYEEHNVPQPIFSFVDILLYLVTPIVIRQ